MYHPSWWLMVLMSLTLTQVAAFATSIYLHRTLAHGALRVHPALDFAFQVASWLTTGQRRREWVAVHRKHHAFTDVEGDPHSPRLLGFWHVQLLNPYYYAREARNPETLWRYGRDVKENWLDRHTMLGVSVVGPGLLVLAFGWRGIATGLLHGILYVFVLAPLINALGHWKGQKNFENTASNHPLAALATAGEALHNNHHYLPTSPKFSVRQWERDPSWGAIVALRRLGLVQVKKPVMTYPALVRVK